MIRAALVCLLGTSATAEGIDVLFRDGDGADRFIAYNQGCPISNAVITLDFTSSAGGIVIDTAYGGGGSRDPMDVTLIEGDAQLRAVSDGDRMLRIDVATFPTLSAITVTMDVDDTVGAFEDARVHANGEEVAGTTVFIAVDGQISRTRLDAMGVGTLTPAGVCALS